VIWALDLIDDGVMAQLAVPLRSLARELAERTPTTSARILFHRTCVTTQQVEPSDAVICGRAAEFDRLRDELRDQELTHFFDFAPLSAPERRALAAWSCRCATIAVSIPNSTWKLPRPREATNPFIGFIARDVR